LIVVYLGLLIKRSKNKLKTLTKEIEMNIKEATKKMKRGIKMCTKGEEYTERYMIFLGGEYIDNNDVSIPLTPECCEMEWTEWLGDKPEYYWEIEKREHTDDLSDYYIATLHGRHFSKPYNPICTIRTDTRNTLIPELLKREIPHKWVVKLASELLPLIDEMDVKFRTSVARETAKREARLALVKDLEIESGLRNYDVIERGHGGICT